MQIAPDILLAPNVCFLCESGRQDGEVWVDTLRNFDAGKMHNLNGRKYVCERCATSVAKFFGLASDRALREAEHERDEAKAVLRAVRYQLDEVTGKIAALAQLPASAVFPEEVVVGSSEPEAPSTAGDEAGSSGSADSQPERKPRATRSRATAAAAPAPEA